MRVGTKPTRGSQSLIRQGAFTHLGDRSRKGNLPTLRTPGGAKSVRPLDTVNSATCSTDMEPPSAKLCRLHYNTIPPLRLESGGCLKHIIRAEGVLWGCKVSHKVRFHGTWKLLATPRSIMPR